MVRKLMSNGVRTKGGTMTDKDVGTTRMMKSDGERTMKGKESQGWKKDQGRWRGRTRTVEGQGKPGESRVAEGRGERQAAGVYVPRLHKLSRETDNVG